MKLFLHAVVLAAVLAAAPAGLRVADAQTAATQQDNAFAEKLKAANAGDSVAMVAVGNLYAGGVGTAKSDEKAVAWYRKAADAGNSTGMVMLGVFYEGGRGVAKNQEQAMVWFRKGAELGDADAMLNLGMHTALGMGVPRDTKAADAWYRKAADGGNANAMYLLGMLYQNGDATVAKSESESLAWYRKAAAKGLPDAIAELQKRDAFAVSFKAANAGDTGAMSALGGMYYNGTGVATDPVQARIWWMKAAAAGDAYAMEGMAYLDWKGLGGPPQDLAQALSWFQKAAGVGRPNAMYMVGYFYRTGQAITENDDVALSWFQKASEAGHVPGMSALGVMYYDGVGAAKNPAQARVWWTKAAAAGDATAMTGMGNLYFFGLGGLSKDVAIALSWYRKAAEAGNAIALYQIGYFYDSGIGVTKNRAEALTWFQKAAAKGDPNAIAALAKLGVPLDAPRQAGNPSPAPSARTASTKGSAPPSSASPLTVSVEIEADNFPYVQMLNSEEWAVTGSYYLIHCVNTSTWCDDGVHIPMPFSVNPKRSGRPGISGRDWIQPDDECKPYSFQPRVDWTFTKRENGQLVKVEGQTLGPAFGPYTLVHPIEQGKCAAAKARAAASNKSVPESKVPATPQPQSGGVWRGYYEGKSKTAGLPDQNQQSLVDDYNPPRSEAEATQSAQYGTKVSNYVGCGQCGVGSKITYVVESADYVLHVTLTRYQ